MSMRRTKLLSAALLLLASLVMLVSASLAWFTISTNPEITGLQVTLNTDRALLVSDDGEDFQQAISLGSAFRYFAPLKPISTTDGVNWYLPSYSASGELEDADKFILDQYDTVVTDGYEHANILVYDVSADPDVPAVKLTGVELYQAEEQGYFVYTDFWLMTEEEGGVEVSLSVPDMVAGVPQVESWERGTENTEFSQQYGKKYGSYVLPAYGWVTVPSQVEGEEPEITLGPIDNNAHTAVRVGFLELDEHDEPTGNFTIYEPNADLRGVPDDKPTAGGSLEGTDNRYVLGWDLNKVAKEENGNITYTYSNYRSGYYYPTDPIGWVSGSGKVQPYDGHYLSGNLIVQRGCSWKDSDLKNAINAAVEPGQPIPTSIFNSNLVDNFGKFVKNNGALTPGNTTTGGAIGEHHYITYQDMRDPDKADRYDLGSENIIVELEPGKENAKKIRLFFWLEGQDVDCWNDIASGSFIANLEFAARSRTAAESIDPPAS